VRRQTHEIYDDEVSELGLVLGIRKLMGKDTGAVSASLRELHRPRGYMLPVSPQSVRDTIRQFLIRKGW